MSKTSGLKQLRMLHKEWKFEFNKINEEMSEWKKTVGNMKITWSIEKQLGSYKVDNEQPVLFTDWGILEDIMKVF